MRFGDVVQSGYTLLVLVPDCTKPLSLDDGFNNSGRLGYRHVGFVLPDDEAPRSSEYPFLGTAWFCEQSFQLVERG